MNSISSSLPPPSGGLTHNQALSEDQRTTLSETLSAYDPENLTVEEAQSIVEKLSDAGIAPGRELASAMAEAGFDAHGVGELADNEPPPGPPPAHPPGARPPQAQNQGFSEEMLSTLESLLEEYEGESIDENAIISISKTMQEIFGLEPSGSLINTSA